ncbi:MAG: GTP pyrophosphokinase family protein [Bacilli bacterium]|nr:GTP pyrophosphokinase family protein [Bacilli bacterium]
MENESLFWKTFLLPYELAVGGFLIKLESLRKGFLLRNVHNPIELISGRVKTVNSILEKAERLNIDFNNISEEIYDIAGIRITCKYIQDVYQVLDLLKTRKDINIFLVKDYIKNPKTSGYRSLHIIAKYKVETVEGQSPINIEFQIRTHAMHLWASIEHSLKYKYFRQIPQEIKDRLYQASIISAALDEEMSKIKNVMRNISVDKVRNEEYEVEDYDLLLNSIRR